MDPVTAIANAAGSLFNSVGSIWTSISGVKIEKQRTKQVQELTVQERIKYDGLVKSGNYALAAKLLEDKNSGESAVQRNTYIILGFTFFIVLVIVYTKIRQK